MINRFTIIICAFAILFFNACKKDDIDDTPDLTAHYNAGGATTIFTANSFAFSTPAPNLNAENLATHLDGDAEFEVSFVAAPAEVASGLGSVFNNKSCISCHPSDGRAARPDDINDFSGFFMRASIPGTDAHGGPNPVPGFGTQIQNQAVFGLVPEARFEVSFTESEITYPDGSKASLRKPVYSLSDTYIPMPADAMFSPRIGPPVFGLGLLEAIPVADIIDHEDIDDSDNDGISGKANYVWDEKFQETRLGRFGWKANTPSVLIQNAGAYNGDIGVTSPLFPEETCAGQTNCSGLNDDPEITEEVLDAVTVYLQTLAVPAPRNLEDEGVLQGRKLFSEIGCASCHIPKSKTGIFPGIPAISNQVIYPYTDMLLHDMGDGLADGRPDFLADGKEWKTRPLWGIGMTELVNGHTHFLHDGRARNFEEAILWHGGEAELSTDKFKQLASVDRASLISFLKAL